MKLIKALPAMLKLGLFDENPVFFRFAFLCPALAAAASAGAGLRLGLAALAALTGTGVCCALLRPILHEKLRFACCAVLSAFFVTLADLLFQAYAPVFSAQMGLFVPLVAVGCMALCANGFGETGSALACGLRGLFMGIGAVAALCAAGAVRELLVSGAVNGAAIIKNYPDIAFFQTPAGAFLALGLAAGLFQFISRLRLPARKKPAVVAVPAPESEAEIETIGIEDAEEIAEDIYSGGEEEEGAL